MKVFTEVKGLATTNKHKHKGNAKYLLTNLETICRGNKLNVGIFALITANKICRNLFNNLNYIQLPVKMYLHLTGCQQETVNHDDIKFVRGRFKIFSIEKTESNKLNKFNKWVEQEENKKNGPLSDSVYGFFTKYNRSTSHDLSIESITKTPQRNKSSSSPVMTSSARREELKAAQEGTNSASSMTAPGSKKKRLLKQEQEEGAPMAMSEDDIKDLGVPNGDIVAEVMRSVRQQQYEEESDFNDSEDFESEYEDAKMSEEEEGDDEDDNDDEDDDDDDGYDDK